MILRAKTLKELLKEIYKLPHNKRVLSLKRLKQGRWKAKIKFVYQIVDKETQEFLWTLEESEAKEWVKNYQQLRKFKQHQQFMEKRIENKKAFGLI